MNTKQTMPLKSSSPKGLGLLVHFDSLDLGSTGIRASTRWTVVLPHPAIKLSRHIETIVVSISISFFNEPIYVCIFL